MASAPQSTAVSEAATRSPTAAAASGGTAGRFSARRFLVILIVILLLGIALIAGANYTLDPLHFSASGQRKVAAVLLSGRNYAVFDANIDFRALRRQAIAQMTQTPDVIIFGGSRFELATADFFPGKTYYNAFVHNDTFEDLVAIAGLLYERNRLPKNLVMTVRYKTFLPIDQKIRETDEFKLFWPEYRSMAERLRIPKEPWYEIMPFAYWSHLLSVSNIARHVSYRLQGKHQRPVDVAAMDDMDVLHADGSMSFSAEHSASFKAILLSRGVTNMFSNAETIDEDAEQRGRKAAQLAEWPVDPKRLEALSVLLGFLKEHGTYVTIAITPHHPAYWKAIQGSPFGNSLVAMEERVRTIAAASGAAVVGSLDPERVGCTSDHMRDFIHPDIVCLQAVFKDIQVKS